MRRTFLLSILSILGVGCTRAKPSQETQPTPTPPFDPQSNFQSRIADAFASYGSWDNVPDGDYIVGYSKYSYYKVTVNHNAGNTGPGDTPMSVTNCEVIYFGGFTKI